MWLSREARGCPAQLLHVKKKKKKATFRALNYLLRALNLAFFFFFPDAGSSSVITQQAKADAVAAYLSDSLCFPASWLLFSPSHQPKAPTKEFREPPLNMLTPVFKIFLLPAHYVCPWLLCSSPVGQKPGTLRISMWVDDLFALACVRARNTWRPQPPFTHQPSFLLPFKRTALGFETFLWQEAFLLDWRAEERSEPQL